MAEGFTPAKDYQDGYLDDYRDYEGYGDEAENIEMKNRDDWEQTPDEFAKPPEEETPFVNNLPETPGSPMSLEKQEKIKSFYKYLEDCGYTVDKNAQLEHGAVYKMNADKELAISYEGKYIRLTDAKNPNEFLSPKTLASKYGEGGTHFVRDDLGIKATLPAIQLKEELNKITETIASKNSSPERQENIEMQTIEQVKENLNDVLEASTQTELALGPEGSLPFRELAGLDLSLRNMRTTVKKIISDREAKKETLKLLKEETSKVAYDDGEVQFSENLREKQKQVKSLEEEIEALNSEIREYDGKFRNQTDNRQDAERRHDFGRTNSNFVS